MLPSRWSLLSVSVSVMYDQLGSFLCLLDDNIACVGMEDGYPGRSIRSSCPMWKMRDTINATCSGCVVRSVEVFVIW